MHLIRSIIGYDQGEFGEIKVEYILPSEVTLDFLQKLFGESSEDPMFECYRITEEHLKALQPYLPEKINLNQYQFFLETYREE